MNCCAKGANKDTIAIQGTTKKSTQKQIQSFDLGPFPILLSTSSQTHGKALKKRYLKPDTGFLDFGGYGADKRLTASKVPSISVTCSPDQVEGEIPNSCGAAYKLTVCRTTTFETSVG
ncbi:unnamed protein product [Lepeophtheirus salmonis]|uniref:(salmon louse) hypothetical protein n=1 Tax=Lepeophtheirus salmonis TaxID=72036 RepID=A0A7R8D2A4_LEPSM|nr:unnamed protein product [Lepeophtheirus salmonis]CAF3003491.1 unnamed protein product [Lepeophtheirus salmonis]